MNTATETTYRNTTRGIVATRGNRELHILGTSVNNTMKARELLASNSFDRLYKAATIPGNRNMRNTRFIKLP